MNYDDRAGRSFGAWGYRDEVCCFGMTVVVPTAALYVFGGLSDAVMVLVRFQSRAWGMLTSDRYETANLCA